MPLRIMLCPEYTHSRAAKRPFAAFPATPALGHRRCLIAFTVFRGAQCDVGSEDSPCVCLWAEEGIVSSKIMRAVEDRPEELMMSFGD